MFGKRAAHQVKKRFLRIGIRQQLIFLVILVAMFSVMVLAVVTGIYFSTNYKNMRSDRLTVIAQLKASQVEQNLNFLYYQAYWLAAKDTIQTSLVSYRAGNTSDSNWTEAEDNIEQFLQSTVTFASVRVYDTKFSAVIDSSANWSNIYIPEDVQDSLFPLDIENYTIPDSIDTTGFITGPLRNDSETFVMSMTIPVFSQASILFDSSDLVGYITTTMTAQSLATVLKDNSTALHDSTVVILIADTLENTTVTSNTTYHYAFPEESAPADYPKTFRVGDNEIAEQVLKDQDTGSDSNTKTEQGTSVAAGYCPVDFDMVTWGAVIEQKRSTFMQPSEQFIKIITGVCFAIAVFMAIVTFPLAHWAVQPILELQKATERIATGRGLQAPFERHRKDKDGKYNEKNSARASMHSTGNENFVYPPTTPTPSPSPPADGPNSEAASVSSGVASNPHPSYLQDARVPTYKRIFYDELSKLTETFNAMTDELDRQYTNLEDRVKARTKQLEAAKIQAEAANEAKTVFIANISHELRTPLNGILGMTAIAMAETDPTKIQQSLKLIFRSGELLLHILTELLTFSKNSLRRSKLENADFSVMEVALQIKSIFSKLAKDQNVNLSITVTPNVTRRMVLYGDSNRIIQIVMNLVSNSLKFTPVDGKVTVTVRNLGEYDEKKSKDSNYQKAFVLPNSSPANCTKPQKQIKQYGSSTSEETELSQRTSLDDDMDDAKSVATVSTSSYDDALFKSQFKVSGGGDEVEKPRTRAVTEQKKWVFEFVVEDTGPGIDPKLQDAVFEPFVQGDQTLSRQYGGTGLGLSICRQLASMMNGVMELESTVGVGSKFTFKVPLTQTRELIVDESDSQMYEDEFNIHSKKNRKVKILEPEEHRSPEDDLHSDAFTTSSERQGGYFSKAYLNSTGTAKASSSSLHSVVSSKAFTQSEASKNLSILVAEDNNVNQEVIKRMLNLEGFTDIALAVDGEEAIDLVKEKLSEGKEYDIIFMDVQMPKVDGLMATRTIIQDLGYKGPIVALTAFADESNVKECLDAGMNGFLSKPIRRSQLRQILLEFAPVEFNDEVLTPTTE